MAHCLKVPSQYGKIINILIIAFIRELVQTVVAHLEGAYALAFKSVHYPGECVVACCGSPLILGTALSQTSADMHMALWQCGQTGFET